MWGYAEKRGEWMVFWTKPYCFLVYRKIGDYPAPEWELNAFCQEQARKAREFILAGGPERPAW